MTSHGTFWKNHINHIVRGLSQEIVCIANISNRVMCQVWKVVGIDKNIIFLLHNVTKLANMPKYVFLRVEYLRESVDVQRNPWLYAKVGQCHFFLKLQIHEISNYHFVLFINRKHDINILIRLIESLSYIWLSKVLLKMRSALRKILKNATAEEYAAHGTYEKW